MTTATNPSFKFVITVPYLCIISLKSPRTIFRCSNYCCMAYITKFMFCGSPLLDVSFPIRHFQSRKTMLVEIILTHSLMCLPSKISLNSCFYSFRLFQSLIYPLLPFSILRFLFLILFNSIKNFFFNL